MVPELGAAYAKRIHAHGQCVGIVQASLQSFTGDFRPRPDLAQLMLTTLPAFGECERDLIRERQREGIAIAKGKGVYKGRKKALGPQDAHELVAQARAGIPKADLARAYGISRETVYQYLRQY